METKLYKNPEAVRTCLQGDCNTILRIIEPGSDARNEFSVQCDFNVDEILSENVVRREMNEDPKKYAVAGYCEVIPRKPAARTSAGFLRGMFAA